MIFLLLALLVQSQDLDVYLGAGCFWHYQHSFIDAEINILNRKTADLTSVTGYAGGKRTTDVVCYHNSEHKQVYADLGFAEVVGLTIPEEMFFNFIQVYFSLFINGERSDPGDRGAEYRSQIGFPGGVDSHLFPIVEKFANANGFNLTKGLGSDPDTLWKKTIYIMDSNQFPFHQAESYHQFHDDFRPGQYDKSYHDIKTVQIGLCNVHYTGCPGDNHEDTKPCAENHVPVPSVIPMYFGAGCFWHMQHLLVEAEKNILNRINSTISCLTGYAGSVKTQDGHVCYSPFYASYEDLGHAEVAFLDVPIANIEDFTKIYFDQFNGYSRVDPLDRGSAYRSLVGLPGGINSPYFALMKNSLPKTGDYPFNFIDGKGSDADNFNLPNIYVMDSNKFPAYQAEIKHQFQDDMNEAYPPEYHALFDLNSANCRVHSTGCPEDKTNSCPEKHDPTPNYDANDVRKQNELPPYKSKVKTTKGALNYLYSSPNPNSEENNETKNLDLNYAVLGCLGVLLFGFVCVGLYLYKEGNILRKEYDSLPEHMKRQLGDEIQL